MTNATLQVVEKTNDAIAVNGANARRLPRLHHER